MRMHIIMNNTCVFPKPVILPTHSVATVIRVIYSSAVSSDTLFNKRKKILLHKII
jgi:hypothetical protein